MATPPVVPKPNVTQQALIGPAPEWLPFFSTFFNSLTEADIGASIGKTVERATTSLLGTYFAYILKWQGVGIGIMLDAWEKAQGESGPKIAEIAARGLSSVFGTAINAADVGNRLGANRTGLQRRLGQAVMDGILEQVQTSAPLSPESGKRSAEGVVGFVVNLATQAWMQGLFFSGPAADWFNGAYADIDDVVARATGSGLMTRRAVSPILRTLVVEPFQRWLNVQYRPRIYNEIQAARALRVGQLSQGEYFNVMAELGWTRERAAVLDVINSRELDKSDALRLLELSLINEEELAALLRASGYNEDAARVLARSLQEDRVRTLRNTTAGVVRDMYRDRDMEAGEARAWWSELGYTDLEQRTMMNLADLERLRPKRLTRGDMERAYAEGFITLGELNSYYGREGYEVGDQVLLTRMAAAKAEPAEPRPLTEADAEQAFVGGLIGPGELRGVYAARGYGQREIDILIGLAEQRKAKSAR